MGITEDIKMQRKITRVMLLCMIVLSFVTMNSMTASAKSKNVTKTFKDKKAIKTMLDDTWWYVWSELAFDMKKNDVKTVKFSNAKNRKKMLEYYVCKRYNIIEKKKLTAKKMNKASQNLFGCNTSNKNCHPGAIVGSSDLHQIKIQKINKTGKNTYSVQCTLGALKKLNGKQYSKMGTYTYYVKVNKKSSYGYVLQKIKFKKDGKNPKWLDL